jgi:hypothetical protein
MQMAKLTAAQKRELKRLHQSRTGIVVQHYGIQLMQVYGGLQAKGLVDNQMYHDQTRFTLTESGLALAASLFGSSEPTPPVTPSPAPTSEPETVAGEVVDAPVASLPACDWCKSTENVSMRYYRGHAVMQVCEDCMPSTETVDPDDMLTASRAQWNERTEGLIADSEIPFAEGLDDPYDAELLWDDTIAFVAAYEVTKPATRYFNQRMGYVPVALRNQKNAVKGHKSDEKRIVAQIPNMQRLKQFKPFSVENTAMPIAPLTIVPKVTKAALTRWLETRNRRAA